MMIVLFEPRFEPRGTFWIIQEADIFDVTDPIFGSCQTRVQIEGAFEIVSVKDLIDRLIVLNTVIKAHCEILLISYFIKLQFRQPNLMIISHTVSLAVREAHRQKWLL